MAATLSRPVAEAADESLPIYIELPQVQTRRGYLVFKRCFDFTFALLALIVLAVPMGSSPRSSRWILRAGRSTGRSASGKTASLF